MIDQIFNENCLTGIPKIPDQSVDLVLTSPPYALKRKKYYDSINEEEYPQWTVSWMKECARVLKPEGSVIIVIRTHIHEGQISPYVIKTRLALWEDGWIEPEELIWIKPDAPPLGHKKRLRRSWENLLWFAKNGKNVFINTRGTGKFSENIGFETTKGLGTYRRSATKHKEGIARGKDYFEVYTALCDKSKWNIHPAQYPVPLAQQIISVFSPHKGVVLDPFMGSGSTAIACIKTERYFIGFETNPQYCEITQKRINLLKNQ